MTAGEPAELYLIAIRDGSGADRRQCVKFEGSPASPGKTKEPILTHSGVTVVFQGVPMQSDLLEVGE